MIRFLRGLWPHARPPRTPAELEQQARDRRAAEAAAARQQREAEAERWVEAERQREADEASAAFEEAQRARAEFEDLVRLARCVFPNDVIERAPASRLSGRGAGWLDRLFQGWR